jgi:hypothetical protein
VSDNISPCFIFSLKHILLSLANILFYILMRREGFRRVATNKSRNAAEQVALPMKTGWKWVALRMKSIGR